MKVKTEVDFLWKMELPTPKNILSKMNSTTVMKARANAYQLYKARIEEMNRLHNGNWNPHPYENFQWNQCVLCKIEIRDDPYGHNPSPIANEGVCCTRCNRYVVDARIANIH